MGFEIKYFDLSMNDKKNLSAKGIIFVPESDYDLAKIYVKDRECKLYLIPTFGEEPRLEKISANAEEYLKLYN